MVSLTAQQFREILCHGQQYRRAVNLLNEQWEVHENRLKYDLVEPRDVSWARLLQDNHLVTGNVKMTDYRGMSELVNRHPEWFSAAGRAALLADFG